MTHLVTDPDLMTEENASALVARLIQSFPSCDELAPRTKAILEQQLISILTGKTKAEGKAILNPEFGIAGTTNKLTAYNVNRWLDDYWHKQRPSSHNAIERIADASHKADPLEAERRQVIASAHKLSAEEGIKLSDLLDHAVEAAADDKLKALLQASADKFRHLPAPKFTVRELQRGKRVQKRF